MVSGHALFDVYIIAVLFIYFLLFVPHSSCHNVQLKHFFLLFPTCNCYCHRIQMTTDVIWAQVSFHSNLFLYLLTCSLPHERQQLPHHSPPMTGIAAITETNHITQRPPWLNDHYNCHLNPTPTTTGQWWQRERWCRWCGEWGGWWQSSGKLITT